MARVNSTSTSADVRGRLGGAVLSSNAQSTYIKSFVPPVRMRSPEQQEQRRLLALYSEWYSNLGPGTPALWEAAAALPAFQRVDWWGNPYALTGRQLFVLTSLALHRVALPPVSSPPAPSTPPMPGTVTAVLLSSVSALPQTISCPAPWATGVDYVLIDVQFRLGQSAQTPDAPLSPLTYFTRGGADTQDLEALILPRWGKHSADCILFVHAYSLRVDGRLSAPVSYRFVGS